MPYWTLDNNSNTPGLFKNRQELELAYKGRLTGNNLNYHFSVCKKTDVTINNIRIVRFPNVKKC